MGARHRMAVPALSGRPARRIACLMVGAGALAAAFALGDGRAQAVGSTHDQAVVAATASASSPVTTVPGPMTPPPAPVPPATTPSTVASPVMPAPTAANGGSSPGAGEQGSAQPQPQSQPQPAIGAPAGTNPWDDPNAG